MSPHDYACWLTYLKIFALQTPMGLPVKITVGVTAYDGERIAKLWRQQPRDVADAYGRPFKQVETEDRVLAVEWLVVKEEPKSLNPVTWGMQPPQLPKP